MPDNQEWLTTTEIADRLQISDNTIRDRIRKINKNQPILERKKINRSYVYSPKSVEMLTEADNLYTKNFTHAEVMKALEEKYLKNGDVETPLSHHNNDPLKELTVALIGFMTEFKRANDLVERKLDFIINETTLVLAEPAKKKPTKKTIKKKTVSKPKRGVSKKKPVRRKRKATKEIPPVKKRFIGLLAGFRKGKRK